MLRRWIERFVAFANSLSLGNLKIEIVEEDLGPVAATAAIEAPEPSEATQEASIELPEEELDLEPVKSFMEDYVGQVVVDILQRGEIEFGEIGLAAAPSIVMSVTQDGEKIRFGLVKLDGKPGGSLLIAPTKFGMFTEKLSEEEFSANSIYRIRFYGGLCLEYLDTQGKGLVEYQES